MPLRELNDGQVVATLVVRHLDVLHEDGGAMVLALDQNRPVLNLIYVLRREVVDSVRVRIRLSVHGRVQQRTFQAKHVLIAVTFELHVRWHRQVGHHLRNNAAVLAEDESERVVLEYVLLRRDHARAADA